MNSIRNDILHCLNEFNDDEQELIAAIEHIVDRKGKKVYAVVFDVLANLEMLPHEAEAFWHQIVSHCLLDLHFKIATIRRIRMIFSEY